MIYIKLAVKNYCRYGVEWKSVSFSNSGCEDGFSSHPCETL